MSVRGFSELVHHVGHELECVTYAGLNVAVECVTCGTVLMDADREGDSDGA